MQLRLRLTVYALQYSHFWARDRGSPHRWQNCAKSKFTEREKKMRLFDKYIILLDRITS